MPDTDKPRVAFLGLGYMGSRMARRLQDAGYPLTVWNRDPAKAAPLAEAGAAVADTAADAVQGAEFVFSSLADDGAVRSVLLGEQGAIAAMPNGAILCECSTVSPALAREVYNAAHERGLREIDCPVAGSTPQAEAGILLFFVGGDEDAFRAAEPIILHMGKAAHYLGESGSGATAKLVVNTLLGLGLQAVAEAVALGRKGGLDRDKLVDVLGEVAVISPGQKAKLPNIKSGDYAPNFPLRLMHKDYGLALDLASELHVPMPAAAAARQASAIELAKNGPEEDVSVLFRLMATLAGVE